MIGAIVGDVIGSYYERFPIKTKDFDLFLENKDFRFKSRFTDDTVMTVAVADSLMSGIGYVDIFHEYVSRYPTAGYGPYFYRWCINKQREPYGSFGNGSAMRVSPVAYFHDSLEEVLEEAEASALVTHNSDEGVNGAKSVAMAIFMARNGFSKEDIKIEIEKNFGYNLSARLDEIRKTYSFEVSCSKSVPESIISFLESNSYEDAIRNAISLGGDADTMACIAGSIAEPFYGAVPNNLVDKVFVRIDDHLRDTINCFFNRYVITKIKLR